MDFTKEQREAIRKGLSDVRAAQRKHETASVDLNEKVNKLKTLAAVTGENATRVIDETLKVMGTFAERFGWAEED